MTLTALPKPTEQTPRRPRLREYHCPRCTRYLFSSNAANGVTRQHCRSCRKWLHIDLESGDEAKVAA